MNGVGEAQFTGGGGGGGGLASTTIEPDPFQDVAGRAEECAKEAASLEQHIASLERRLAAARTQLAGVNAMHGNLEEGMSQHAPDVPRQGIAPQQPRPQDLTIG